MPTDKHRATISLSTETNAAANVLMERRSATLSDVVRRAITHEKYLDDAVNDGAKVLIEYPDGRVREVVFS